MTFRSALLTLLPLAVAAQSPSEEEKAPALTASLIPVGANSDAYWVGDGPGIRAIPLDPEAAPPATLAVREREGLKTIPTILNRPSPALRVRAGTLRIYEGQEAGSDGEPPLFAEFRLPPTPGHYDIFLNRAADRKGWQDAESLILPASPTAFPDGTFRLVNLSAAPVKWRIGGEITDLAPRSARIVPLRTGSAGKLVPVQAAHADGDAYKIILQTGIRLAADQRANLIVYPGRNPKKPCEVTWYYQSEPSLEATPDD